MKKSKIIYWTSTAIISAMMLFSAYSYLTNDQVKSAFVHFGFPGYFRIELAMAKLLGALVLVIPGIPATIRQFAYFGFALTFLSAFVAHTSMGDTVVHTVMPLIFLVILVISYFYNYKITSLKTN